MKIHERIIELFEAEGIKSIFGIPDPSFFSMFLHAESRGWNVVAPHHEEAASFMAEASWRMTGKPVVVIGNKGPGVANLVSGAIHAAKENIPTIYIGGQRHRLYEQRVRRGKMQYLSQPRMFEAAMKYVGVIEYPEQTDEIVREAIRRALSGVPGPVYIDFPQNVLGVELNVQPPLAPDQYRLVDQQAGADAIERAVTALETARSPILLVGQGAHVTRAHALVAELALALDCPIIQTTGALSVIEGMDERTFPYGTPVGNTIVGESDVVVAIGTELGEPLHYGRGRHWKNGQDGRKWIYIENDPTAIGVNRPIDVPLVGDLRAIVPQLTKAAKGRVDRHCKKRAAWRAEHDRQLAEELAAVPETSVPIHPARLAVEATRVLPKDAVIVRDGGASSLFFTQFLQMRPRDFFWNQNYGSIGPGLPYAVGAQVAVGASRRVVLLTGDSSFLFHISELETAVRKNLPVVSIVWVDHAWGIEVASYRAALGKDTAETEGHWGKQVRLDRIAEGFGAHGEYVVRAEDVAAAVERALASGKPAVVHVEVDGSANADMAKLPGILEFRTWYGEEGDNLGDPRGSY
ncbi:MAG: thiamine pyrophosphate-binding protein [Xenophilus sp.]